ARRIHLVRDDVDAAEDHLVERGGREGLPRQERPAALHGKVDRGEWSGTRTRFQERRPAAVDNENRSRHQLAALCSPISWKNRCTSAGFLYCGDSASGGKSSTSITFTTASCAVAS